ncbi:MAG: helix-turn-helix transcriptional regulator [Clostridiales bacterium]|nr:helix-turn-helix transcriptional regulator [Clostridiales bacterium]
MPGDLMKNEKTDEERILIQVISDPTRIEIMKTLSVKQSLCGKDILAHFSITQPTLSHHMNLLCSCGLVNSVKEGKFVYYLLNADGVKKVMSLFENLIDEKNDSIKPGSRPNVKIAKGPSLKKKPMLPNPKSVIPSPDLPEETVIKKKKSKKKEKGKDVKKGKKKKKK